MLDLSTVSNGDLLADLLAIPGPKPLHGFGNIHVVFHFAKDYMLSIQPPSLSRADKKLGTVCVGFNICHRQDARAHVLQDEILIVKLLLIDGLATSAMMAYEIPILAQKSQNNPVKVGTIKTKFSSQCSEHESSLLSLELYPKGSLSTMMLKNMVG